MRIFMNLFAGLLPCIIGMHSLYAQGCSDAGFCTVGNLHLFNDTLKNSFHKISFIVPFGMGDGDVFVTTPGIQYDRQWANNWALQAKVTGNIASGNLGNVSGAGDIYLAATRSLPQRSKWHKSISLGLKLPLSNSNLSKENKPFPMQYQSSLGTVDLIAGVSFSTVQWQFAAGWQQPLTGTNGNNFLHQYWPGNAMAGVFPETNDFNRKSDLLLRGAYSTQLSKTIRAHAGLLGIYHVAEDTYINANESVKPIDIMGSKGLTLNVTGGLMWQLNEKAIIGITCGVPLLIRDVRPDGLTRSFVFAPEFSIKF